MKGTSTTWAAYEKTGMKDERQMKYLSLQGDFVGKLK